MLINARSKIIHINLGITIVGKEMQALAYATNGLSRSFTSYDKPRTLTTVINVLYIY